MSQWSTTSAEWYYSNSGESQGPVSAEQLRLWYGQGLLQAPDHVRHQTWDKWWSIADSAEVLGIAFPAPPPGQPTIQRRPPSTSPVITTRPSGSQPPSAPPDAPAAGYQQPVLQPTPSGASARTAAPVSRVGHLAGFGERIGSWVIDLAVLVAALFGSRLVFPGYPPLASLLMVPFYGLYIVVLPAVGGDTLGHLIVGIKVRRAEGSDPPSKLAIAGRGIMVLILAIPMMLGVIASAISAAISPTHRTWYDAATGTVMERTR